MTSSAAQQDLAEPHLRQVLAGVGLDVEYVRAEGNTLHRLDENGRSVPVLDMMGGFGSLILGHHHPRIVARAKELLDARVPVHAQFSRHPYANEVAAVLNDIVHRELGTTEPYHAIFANSGAEAVEAAVKHAEFDRVQKVSALEAEIVAHLERTWEAVRGGTARVPGDVLAALGVDAPADPLAGFDRAAAEVQARNAAELARPPLFLTPEGSFHGKLVGSVQLTHNESFRVPFRSLAAQSRFVPLDDPGAIVKIAERERRHLLDLTVTGDRVVLTERPLPVFCAFVLEPIQGEGGIHPLTAEFVREARRVCDALGCPLVADEIQSGMGRSGAFFAGSLIGLRPDYVTLAKSLGGGIAKTAVTLIRASRYRPEFELLHSSTFAKDGFSTQLALTVLQLLEADDGAVYRRAAERGARLRAALEAVRTEYPEIVREVRGTGLMLGLEFHDQSAATSAEIRELATAGFLGYAVAGYLLREHRVRIFPTGSAVNTLRLEPSVDLTDAEIDQVAEGFRGVCRVLHAQDGRRLVGA